MARSNKVYADSWHYRIYNWWREQSGFDRKKSLSFRENLCHYARVVIIWAFLGWFFVVPIWRQVRPWMIASVLGLTFGLWYGLTYYSEITKTILFYVGLLIALVIGALLILYLIEKSEDNRTARVIFLVLFSPILIPLFAIGYVLSVLWERVLKPYYFTRHTYVRETWGFTILIVLVLLYLIGGWQLYALMGIIFGIVAAMAICATLIVMFVTVLLPYMRERFRDWRFRRLHTWSNTPDREPGINGVDIARNLVESKRGSIICPFIELPNTDM